MSNNNSSVDLSELSDVANDPEGHALARFLMKKDRDLAPVRLYGNLKERRISVCVELNKESTNEVNGRKNVEPQNEPPLRKEKNLKTPERIERVPSSISPLRINNNAASLPSTSTLSNYSQNNQAFNNENNALDNNNLNVPRTPETQRPRHDPQTPKSSQLRTRMYSADRYRRLSFKNLQSNTSRRVLLNELNEAEESSVFSQFEPAKTSTPACVSPIKAGAHATVNQPNIIEKEQPIVPTSSAINSAMTALSKSFVIQKGPKPGQLILTPSDKQVNERPNESSHHNYSIEQSIFPEPVPADATGCKILSAKNQIMQTNHKEVNNLLPLGTRRITDYNAVSMIVTDDEDITDDNDDHRTVCNVDNVNKTVVSVVKPPHSQQILSSNEKETFARPRSPYLRKPKSTVIITSDTDSEADNGDIEDNLHQPIQSTSNNNVSSASEGTRIKKIKGRRPLRKMTPDAVKDYKNATKDMRMNVKRNYTDKSKRSLYSETIVTTPESRVASKDNTTRSANAPSMPPKHKNLIADQVREKLSEPLESTCEKQSPIRHVQEGKQSKLPEKLTSSKSRKSNRKLEVLENLELYPSCEQTTETSLQSKVTKKTLAHKRKSRQMSHKNNEQSSLSDSEPCDSKHDNSPARDNSPDITDSQERSTVSKTIHTQVSENISAHRRRQLNESSSDHHSADSALENAIPGNHNINQVQEEFPQPAESTPEKPIIKRLRKRKQTKLSEDLPATKSRKLCEKLQDLETEKVRMQSHKSKSVGLKPTNSCEQISEPHNHFQVRKKTLTNNRSSPEKLHKHQPPPSSHSESSESEHEKSLESASSNQKMVELRHKGRQLIQSSSEHQSHGSCSENEIQRNQTHNSPRISSASETEAENSSSENESLPTIEVTSNTKHAQFNKKSQNHETENNQLADCDSHENDHFSPRSQIFPKEIPEPQTPGTSKSNKDKNKRSRKNTKTNAEPTRKSTRTRKPVEMHPYAKELWSLAWGERALEIIEKRRKRNELKTESQLHKERETAFDKLRNERVSKQNNNQKNGKCLQPYIKLRRIDRISRIEEHEDIEMPSSPSSSTEIATSKTKESPCSKVISRLLTLPTTTENNNLTQSLSPNDPYINHEKLQFYDNKGIEVGFCFDNTDEISVGFMRFKPLAYKKQASVKFHDMCFYCMEGKFEFMLNEKRYELTEGDLMRVHKGNKYSIKNLLDGISIIQIIKNKPTEE